jgi:uncharacterized protein YjbI with pentapeptide repeats
MIDGQIAVVTALVALIFGAGVLYVDAGRRRLRPGQAEREDWPSALGLNGLPYPLFVLGVLIWSAVALILLGGLLFLFVTILLNATPMDANARLAFGGTIFAFTATVAALGAAVALPLTLRRVQYAGRQTEAAEQGLVTDRINAAVASLGAQKTVKDPEAEGAERTEPNIEVRVGAILALERIARNNLDFHIQIMEILCAYIRINAPANKAKPAEKNAPAEEDEHPPPLPAYPEIGPGEDAQKVWENWRKDVQTRYREFHASRRPRLDIQTALTVLGRRVEAQRKQEARGPSGDGDGVFPFDATYPEPPADPKTYSPEDFARFKEDSAARNEAYRAYPGYRLDLRGTDLQGYDLSGGCWRGARFDGAQMQGVNLHGAQMQGADLGHAQMQGADLRLAQMQGANLWGAQMQGADLRIAQMQGADMMRGAFMRDEKMQRAELRVAQMQGAQLWGAQMQGAILWGTKMQGAILWSARMQGAHLLEAKMQGASLSGAQMQGAILTGTKLDAKTDFRPASLRGAALRGVDLSGVAFDAAILDGSFGDGSVTLPEGMKRPAGWAAEVLDNAAFAERLAAHRAALNGTPDK